MPRLLLVDDDRFVLRALERLLGGEGFYCATAVNAEQARQALSGDPYDLILLDVGLPDTDGFSFCRQIRAQFRLPVILLTARQESAEKVVGLEVGADDYVTKPFDPRELVARVRAHIRRASEYNEPRARSARVGLGHVEVDLDARCVYRDDAPVPLTEREFELLDFLLRHRGRALASEWIFESVWGSDAAWGLKTLTVHVQRLRRKIELDPRAPALIVTVRGFGYRLASPASDGKGAGASAAHAT